MSLQCFSVHSFVVTTVFSVVELVHPSTNSQRTVVWLPHQPPWVLTTVMHRNGIAHHQCHWSHRLTYSKHLWWWTVHMGISSHHQLEQQPIHWLVCVPIAPKLESVSTSIVMSNYSAMVSVVKVSYWTTTMLRHSPHFFGVSINSVYCLLRLDSKHLLPYLPLNDVVSGRRIGMVHEAIHVIVTLGPQLPVGHDIATMIVIDYRSMC